MKPMTKAEARAALSAKRDADLARTLKLSGSRLYTFKDDEVLPDSIMWRVRAILAERQLLELRKQNPALALGQWRITLEPNSVLPGEVLAKPVSGTKN